MELVIGLIAGAFGGNVAGNVARKLDNGFAINSLVGLLGGGLGTLVMSSSGIGAATGGLDLASLIVQAASGTVGGAVLVTVLGMLSNLAK